MYRTTENILSVRIAKNNLAVHVIRRGPLFTFFPGLSKYIDVNQTMNIYRDSHHWYIRLWVEIADVDPTGGKMIMIARSFVNQFTSTPPQPLNAVFERWESLNDAQQRGVPETISRDFKCLIRKLLILLAY